MFRAAKIAAAVILLGWVGMLWSQNPQDWPMADPLGQVLCGKSAFVHGYMLGYGQGFHAADLDLQMVHDPTDPSKITTYHKVLGYQHEFGDKGSFENGYHQGFRVGYADGISGRQFRAVSELRATGLGLRDDKSRPSKVFDEGFSAGYNAGVQRGLRDGRAGIGFLQTSDECQEGFFKSRPRGEEYCSGYSRGYRLGYTDGYMNQAPQVLARTK